MVLTACEPIKVAGVGEEPPVLVVHGTAGGFDQGMTLARHLLSEGFHRISIFRFGYLRTPLPVGRRLVSLDQEYSECVSWRIPILVAR